MRVSTPATVELCLWCLQETGANQSIKIKVGLLAMASQLQFRDYAICGGLHGNQQRLEIAVQFFLN